MRYALVLLLVLSFVMVGCKASPEDKVAKAEKAMEAGDFEKVLEICEDLLSDPSALDADLQQKIAKLKGDAMAKKAAEGASDVLGGD